MTSTLQNIINGLEGNVKELQVNSLHGSVHIDVKTMDFTYIGNFGSLVLNHCIKHNVVNDIPKKLIVLAGHINAYSRTIAGITLVSI